MTDVCMVVHNPCTHDSRVQREAATLAAAGYDVVVLASTAPGLPLRERHSGWRLERLGEVQPAAPGGPQAPSLLRELVRAQPSVHALATRLLTTPVRLRFAVEAYERLCEIAPRIIHSHDLDTLTICARAAAELGAKLVYDSHELFPEVDSALPGPLAALERRALRALESVLIRRADAVVVTSPGHADWLMQSYRIAAPEVLYNAPSRRKASGGDLKGELGIAGPMLLHVGATTRRRGLPYAVAALAEPELDGVQLVLMGPDANGTTASLQALAARHGVADRLRTRQPVPHADVVGWAATADAALAVIEPAGASYRLCLPNKLFECAFAGVPVVASDLPVLGRTVREHRLGVTIADGRPATLARAVKRLLDGSAPRPSAEHREAFIEAYCWERQEATLLGLYERLAPAARADAKRAAQSR